MIQQKTKAFTLVELIIVITILAILATIGFLSYQEYTRDARDGKITTDLNTLSDGLNIYETKNTLLPLPDDYVTITSSGVDLSYQGNLGITVQKLLKTTSEIKDTLDDLYYVYTINGSKTKFQLMGYLENQVSYNSNITNELYAIDYLNRKIETQGDKIGILLNTDNSLVKSNVDVSTGIINYTLMFDVNDIITSSGNLLYSNIYNHNTDLLNEKNLAQFDNSLVGYWDMETTINTGGYIQVKDNSNVGNSLACINSGSTRVNCLGINGGPQTTLGYNNKGSAMTFSGYRQFLTYSYNSNYNSGAISFNDNFTLSLKFRPTGYHQTGYFGIKNILIEKGPLATVNYAIQITDKNTISFIERGPSEGLQYTNFNQIDDMTNKWNSVVLKINSGKIYLYINGNLLKQTSVGYIDPGINDKLYIGGLIGGVGYEEEPLFIGDIDDVRIYNRALSDSEILNLN